MQISGVVKRPVITRYVSEAGKFVARFAKNPVQSGIELPRARRCSWVMVDVDGSELCELGVLCGSKQLRDSLADAAGCDGTARFLRSIGWGATWDVAYARCSRGGL